jgi:hypothetical protein
MSRHLRNVTVAMFEAFLDLAKCNEIKAKRGHHEKWVRADLNRPIIFQKTIDPIPEFIVKNNLRILGYSKADFFNILECKKEVIKNNKEVYEIRDSK